MAISPMQRSLKYLRDDGYLCDIVETFNPYAGKFGLRKDMFHFADIVALKNDIMAVQVFGVDWSSHEKKMLNEPEITSNIHKWISCGGKVMLIGWRKVKVKRGGKAMVWKPRIGFISIENNQLVLTENK